MTITIGSWFFPLLCMVGVFLWCWVDTKDFKTALGAAMIASCPAWIAWGALK